MARKEFLKALFDSHLADLKSIVPGIGDVFLCPICTVEFTEEDMYNESLTDGHVWPQDIREKSGSEIATLQRVLLCQNCNSKAGSRGDKQMQLLEKVKDGDESGKLYGERLVKILQIPREKPIELRASITMSPDTLKGRIALAKSRNKPEDFEKFQSLCGQKTGLSLLVYPYHELKPALASVGWVTSAYLLAFYTFGYRYISYKSLDPVREYILASFIKSITEGPKFTKSDVLGARLCDTHYYKDPEIDLVIPVDKKIPAHLQVSFLNYHVNLPFACVPTVIESLIRLNMPDIGERIPEMIEKDLPLYIPIGCNKSDLHDCVWDYVLGKPIPEL